MSFASYAELVDTICKWANRDDDDFVTRVPDFIRLAEARMQRDLRPFSTRITNFSLPISATTGRAGPYPSLAGIVQVEHVGLVVHDGNIAFSPAMALVHETEADVLEWHAQTPRTGRPTRYTISGQDILVYPFPDVPKDSLGVDSFYKVVLTMVGPSLSFAVPVTSGNFSFNPIVRDHPDLYLYGALVSAEPYLAHDERLPLWEKLFADTISAVNLQHDRLLLGAQAPAPRLPVVLG